MITTSSAHNFRRPLRCSSLVAALLLQLYLSAPSLANDELQSTTWQTPSHDEVRQQLDHWLEEASVSPDVVDEIRELWFEPIEPTDRLSALAHSFWIADETARELVEFCRSTTVNPQLPVFDVFARTDLLPFQRDHLRLLLARSLAQNELYNETLEQIGSIQTSDVVDPASLLFYQAVAYHRLLKKDECLPLVERLLEQEKNLPRRFQMLAKLIRSDIEPLEVDSLDEVSRLMDNIRVRLGHGRAGKRVRTEEEDVIAKLDKMIKEMEDQAAAAAAAAASGGKAGDSANPATPMNDSMPGGVKGPGNVSPKNLGSKSDWGDLPAREREDALQELGKDFPSHYRDVIEQYFRKLASEGSRQ